MLLACLGPLRVTTFVTQFLDVLLQFVLQLLVTASTLDV